MYFYILAFFVGTFFLQFFKTLPGLILVFSALMFLMIGGFFIKYLRFVFIFCLGFFWSLLYVHSIIKWSLPNNLVNKNITVIGYIASLPQQDQLHEKFLFKTDKAILQLNWYGNYPKLTVGDKWHLTVKLKKPHETMNPGCFDYEEYLFQHKVRAVGYVVPDTLNKYLSTDWRNETINRLRQYLSNKINCVLKSPLKGIIAALVVGDRNNITQQQWAVFRNTGTSHLVAISGLHIGLISSFIFLFLKFIWRRIPCLVLRLPASKAGSIGALIGALIYSAMAGFSVPTVRALVMIVVLMLMIFLNRNIRPWHAFFIALLLVVIVNPLSDLSAGFWLSFGAVAMLIYCFSGRLKGGRGLWWNWGHAQLVVILGLMPLCLLLFQQISLAAFFANIIAIPIMGFLIVPLSILGCILNKWLLILAEKILGLLWLYLQWLAAQHWALWHHSVINYWILGTALIGILLIFAPRGFPGRWLGIIWILPLFFYKPIGPQQGDVWFTLLDVGQGLASVMRTQHHILIYDTGPKFSDNFDAGMAMVVPFLRSLGIRNIDIMVVSHGDNDHIGGAQSILAMLNVKRIITSVPNRFHGQNAQYCRAGQNWQWDGINFQFLSPEQNSELHGNDASCVLKITNGKNSILLTGDIEALTEHILLNKEKNKLKTNILVAPHHGSNSSSTKAFVKAVKPNYVLFPVGYLNRYGFPSKKVIARYRIIHANLFNTVDSGAITFKFNGYKTITAPNEYRKAAGRFWND